MPIEAFCFWTERASSALLKDRARSRNIGDPFAPTLKPSVAVGIGKADLVEITDHPINMWGIPHSSDCSVFSYLRHLNGSYLCK
jgi:hypothetical protein